MYLYKLAVAMSICLMIVSALDYVRRAWKRKTEPVPATWILMMVMMGLSGWMYWQNPHKTLTGNIGVMAGNANVAIILTGVMAARIRRYRTLAVAFDGVQLTCLAFGALIVLFWCLTKQPLTSYILVQCIALVAYAATVARLWKAMRTTEPLFLWVSVLLANLCAIYPAWVRHDPYSWIYLARAVPSTVGVIWLIVRIKRRTHFAMITRDQYDW